MQKCLNDIFGGFCSGKPQVKDTETIGTGETGYWKKSSCSLNPKTCGLYVKFSEVVKPAEGLRQEIRVMNAKEAAKSKCASKKKKKVVMQEKLL